MKKIILIIGLLILFNFLFGIHITVNAFDGYNPGHTYINEPTLQDAIHHLTEPGSHLIEVFALLDETTLEPEETIYYETVELPPCTVTMKVYEPHRGFVIIDSGEDPLNPLINHEGHTAITVLPGSDDEPDVAVLDGFIIQRNEFVVEEEEDSGVVVLGRNTLISNCVFGSRDITGNDNLNFYKSIYFEYIGGIGKTSIRTISITECEFIRSCNIGEYTIFCTSSNNGYYKALIYDNNLIDCGKGLSIDNSMYIEINNNDLHNNEFFNVPEDIITGIYARQIYSSLFSSEIENNTLSKHDVGINISTSLINIPPFHVFTNELKYQKVGIKIAWTSGKADILDNLIHIYQEDDEVTGIHNFGECSINNNTIYRTDNGNPDQPVSTAIDFNDGWFYYGSIWNDSMVNNILWGFDESLNFTDYTSDLIVNYTCYNGLINEAFLPDDPLDNHNINDDPLFISYLPEEEYFCHLSETSPCIDAGDPSFPPDPDGSIRDMGCYPYEHDYDTITFKKGINWISLPRIGISPNNNTNPATNDLVDILETIEGFQEEVDNVNIWHNTDINTALMYDRYSTPLQWNPTDYDANSYWLYKVEILPNEEEWHLTIDGERLPSNFNFLNTNEPALEAGEYHWLGYWLFNEDQNIVDAFGQEYWDYVERVKAEDWYYDRCVSGRGIDDPEPVSWSTTGKTMEYGKGYMVWFLEGTPDITDFHWNSSGTTEVPTKKAESNNFIYSETPDYEVIDVVEIPENVVEIGVYQDETCVGAVVVTSSSEQILVYSNNTSREPIPYNFEVITNNRSLQQQVKNYQIYNSNSGEFETGYIVSGQQENSIIMFGELGEPNHDIPSTNEVELRHNFPNPFNPETNIAFSIPLDQKVTLTIYNLKGQKVRELVNGQFVSGEHSIVWNGKDDNDKQVGSGLYFYKLKTHNKEISKKMLLLK